MRTSKYLAVALAAWTASGAALAMPSASETTVHIVPDFSRKVAPAKPDTLAPDASTPDQLTANRVSETSQIEWPVVSGDEAAKAVAAQRASIVTPPKPTLVVNVNLSTQRMTVSENGVAKYTWPVSSGRQGYETPTGVFKPTWKTEMWYSRQYDMSPMPHSVFFSNGAAIHATYATHQLGFPASHGCVRLSPGNAKSFYGLVGKHGMDRTRITVRGTPKFKNWEVANRRPYYGPRRYVMAPYGYAPPGYFSQQYFKPALRAQYRSGQPRRVVQRANAQPGYSSNGSGLFGF
jgi:lipoprotein-anchoring transpeptidase ErfK/SrfK